VSYHEHNKAESGPKIAERILNGENCALVTDAGMPAISDPGEELVRLCREHAIEVEAIPGPCAFITALAVSGMPSRRFIFEGFPPADKKERAELFESLAGEERTIIFHEAPHRLCKTLSELLRAVGNREAAIVRELTKIHEEVILTDIESACRKYSAEEPRGEFVIIIKGSEKEKIQMTFEQVVKYALELVKGGESKTDAAKKAAKESGFKKNEIYAEIIK
jgi:16S rRNA (cytidine1402-2'-O)-methyltransferase